MTRASNSRDGRQPTERVGLDHLPHVSAYTADWSEDRFRELA